MNLDNANDKYHYCIGKVLTKNTNLHTVATELTTDNCSYNIFKDTSSMNNFRKKFLLEERLIDNESTESYDNTQNSNSDSIQFTNYQKR